MQIPVHAEYPEAFCTAPASEMSLQSGGVCNQTMILDKIANKQKSHQQDILDISILPLLDTFLVWYHHKKSVPSSRQHCLSSLPGEVIQAHREAASCVLYENALLASPGNQQQGTRLSAGEKGGWEGQCRAPVCQKGPSILMPPTAEPSAGYYT